MNECMHGLTFVCVCVCVCGCVCGWVVRSTCLQGGAVYISYYAKGIFTNCNFTSNSAEHVSLEEEHVDDCEMSECMTLRLCPPYIHS